MHKKIFQINFKSKDGSLFVSVPYANLGVGRVGVVECPAGNPESLLFGESAPVTTHAVKYAHHPDGEAHFSLDGKVFTRVRRKAVPLTAAEGHVFTVMVQGLHLFDDIAPDDIASRKRGIVPMPLSDGPIEALKFVGHLYSSSQFAKRLRAPKMDSVFIPLLRPDGRRLVGVALGTRLARDNRQYLLVVSVEPITMIARHTDLCVWLMGGFDPPDIAFDHSRSMGFLMMICPEVRWKIDVSGARQARNSAVIGRLMPTPRRLEWRRVATRDSLSGWLRVDDGPKIASTIRRARW